jgi:eukaryotic-like serine/threonine-protein kinase
MHGHDLSVELETRGPVAITDAVRYLLETCEALAQAHALRIVHRDLKPANLFLAETPGRRPIVKVLDFGISKVVDGEGAALTKTASVMGTPYYMSPEQLLSAKNVDERSDIWALGIILYELLTGQPPFTADTAPEIIAKIVQNCPAPPGSLRAEIPPGLEAIIMRCLRTRVEERFADVAKLSAVLQPFAARGDRESATAIAKVLGRGADMEAPMDTSVASTEPAPFVASGVPATRRSAPPIGLPGSDRPRPDAHAGALPVPPQSPSTVASGSQPALGTAHNLSVSSARLAGAPLRRRAGIIGTTGLVLTALVVVVAYRQMRNPASATSAGRVASSTTETSLLPVATTVSASPDALLPSALPAQPPADPVLPPPPSATSVTLARTRHPSHPSPAPGPASAASPQAAAPLSSSSASPAKPLAQSPANPLDIPMK